MDIKDIKIGETYHNGGKRKRTVVGWLGYMIAYKTPTDYKKGITQAVPLHHFAKWAKGKVE